MFTKKPFSIEGERISSNDIKYYLIRWEGQSTDPSQFTWEQESNFDPNSELVLRFMESNSASFSNKQVQTDHSICVFDRPPKPKIPDYFENFVPQSVTINEEKRTGELWPVKIISFDQGKLMFEIINADVAESIWVSASTLLAIAPSLVAKYFIERERSNFS